MEDINIVLNNSIKASSVEAVSPGLSVPSGEPEEPTSSDDRHLSHRLKEDVAAKTLMVLPLYFPSVKTKFIAISIPNSVCEAAA